MGDPGLVGLVSVCFHALEDTKQKKPTPLDRGPPLHVNRVLVLQNSIVVVQNNGLERQKACCTGKFALLLIKSIDLDAISITVPV